MKKQQIYIGVSVLGSIIVLLYIAFHGGFTITSVKAGCLVWGDGFAMTGVLLILLAGCLKLDRLGVWDWFLYILYQARFLLLHEKDKTYTNFHDFCQLRERVLIAPVPIFRIGILWFMVGGGLSAIYYHL